MRAVSEVGVVKLGQLAGRDPRIIHLMDDSKLLTIGHTSAEADWPRLWSARLGLPMGLLSVRVHGQVRYGAVRSRSCHNLLRQAGDSCSRPFPPRFPHGIPGRCSKFNSSVARLPHR